MHSLQPAGTVTEGVPIGSSFPAARDVAAASSHSGGMMENKGGMNDEEARAFHGYFIMGMSAFVLTAVGAHLLAWSWRPWL